MPALYRRNKGLKSPKMQKSAGEMVLMPEQVQQILDTINASDVSHEIKRRDHALIYLASKLGLRCGEVVLLSREHFEEIAREIANIPTLKQTHRVAVTCPHCLKQSRVAERRIGRTAICYKCHGSFTIEAPRDYEYNGTEPALKSPPLIEDDVIRYIQNYIAQMPAKNQYLFQSKRGSHLSIPQARAIFNFWLTESGLPSIYSFHALRHGRGAHVWEATKDLQAVREMLRQKSLGAAEKYIHWSPSGRNDLRRKLGGAR